MKRWLIVALLLLAACTTSTDRTTRGVDFRTGSEGLYFDFAANMPPSQVYDDQTVDVLLELENRGATNVGGAGDRIYLTGFDSSIITGIPVNGLQIPYMQGKNVYGPGDKSYVSFKGVPVSLLTLNIDKYTPRLQATACYQYDTLATANVCIDPDPNSVIPRDKVCTATSVSAGTQGAPVAVGSVQVVASPGTTRFEISIQNVGTGTPFRSGVEYLQKCSPNDPAGLAYNEVQYVELVDVSVAGRSIKNSCRPVDNGLIRLNSGSATIFCQLDNIPSSAAFTSPLTVDLRYGYRQSLQRDLTLIQSTR